MCVISRHNLKEDKAMLSDESLMGVFVHFIIILTLGFDLDSVLPLFFFSKFTRQDWQVKHWCFQRMY